MEGELALLFLNDIGIEHILYDSAWHLSHKCRHRGQLKRTRRQRHHWGADSINIEVWHNVAFQFLYLWPAHHEMIDVLR